ncbi:phage Gp37/Gp68 family protein [Desulfobacterales bacterium HSG17]|nr:phage Gp37/Gp68 family protein [Desulfobacterales bacterium HSG17]
MSPKTKIEWTESTWNPVTGCTKISKGCQNCYAERMSKRLAGRHGYSKDNPFQVTLHPNRLLQPLKWKGNHIIFVCSMGDIFHKDVPEDYILQVLDIIKKSPNHTFQILTKRAKRMLQISEKIKKWPENVWMGVTVESKSCIKRIDLLNQVKSTVRFLSCEPLLNDLGRLDLKKINWVIVGGESGFKARPMAPKWATNIRDQCLKADIPYFFKQWGGFNKKKAGRHLEGQEWNQMPKYLHQNH